MEKKLGKRVRLRMQQRVKHYPPTRRITLLLGLSILIGIIFLFTEVQAQDNIESGRIIVKYKATTDKDPGVYLRQNAPLQPITGAASIDSVNQSINVISAKPLFRKTYVEDLRESQDVFLKEMDAVKSRFQKRTLRIPEDATIPDAGNIYLLEVAKGTDMKAAVNLLAEDPFIEYAELPQPSEFHFPNDYYYKNIDGTWHSGSWGNSYPDLWGLKNIQVEEAWQIATGNNVVVAVVDSGVDYNHTDFDRVANGWVNYWERNGYESNCSDGQDDDGNGRIDDCYGWDFMPMYIDNVLVDYDGIDNDPMDHLGHGTHVTGIMAAKQNNGIGIVGIAHGSKFMILKAYNYDPELVSAINYAVDEGADIINCSWGTFNYSSTLYAALDFAYATGVAVVASAGNRDGAWFYWPDVSWKNLPASHAGAITVGASAESDLGANFSRYGNYVDLIAPGGNDGDGNQYPFEEPPLVPNDDARHNILSLRAAQLTEPPFPTTSWLDVGTGNYRYYRVGGTSMSVPHVSGVAALIMSAESNNLNLKDIYDVLRVTADDRYVLGSNEYLRGVDYKTGFGRLNANNAVRARCLTPYVDVPTGFWAETEIRRITCRGITTGCTTSNFCPNGNITEASAAVFIIRAKYTDDFDSDPNPHFTDVPPSHWAFRYIQKMYDDGINTAGCGSNMYCPDNLVDRAHAAKYIIKANYAGPFTYPPTPPFIYPLTPYFTDVPNTDPFFPYIQKLAEKGATSGCGGGLYCPTAITNRAQMASFIVKKPDPVPAGYLPLFKIWTKGRFDPN